MLDEKIVELYWNRDENAISATAEKYGGYCSSIAGNILHSVEDCEECVNDTWLRTWYAIPPQRPRNLRMFLAKITRNLAFDRYKAQTADKRSGEITVILDELAECITTGVTAEDHVIANALKDTVNRFVRKLPLREGNVFVRRYFFGETAEDIGNRYGLSAGNVMVILSRTRQKLRIHLKKEGFLP